MTETLDTLNSRLGDFEARTNAQDFDRVHAAQAALAGDVGAARAAITALETLDREHRARFLNEQTAMHVPAWDRLTRGRRFITQARDTLRTALELLASRHALQRAIDEIANLQPEDLRHRPVEVYDDGMRRYFAGLLANVGGVRRARAELDVLLPELADRLAQDPGPMPTPPVLAPRRGAEQTHAATTVTHDRG